VHFDRVDSSAKSLQIFLWLRAKEGNGNDNSRARSDSKCQDSLADGGVKVLGLSTMLLYE
jgi:hypothetical protein